MNTKKLPLAFWIFVGLVVGIVAGLALMAIPGGVDFAKTYVKPFGTIFLNLIKFIVVPIVLFSITAGIISMGDIKKLGSVGVKTIVYYMCTTALAVVIALSRLYLYAHWPTDILGGAAVGILAGWLGTKLAQSFPRKKV